MKRRDLFNNAYHWMPREAAMQWNSWCRSALMLVIASAAWGGATAAAAETPALPSGLTAEFLRNAADDIQRVAGVAASGSFEEEESHSTTVGEEEDRQASRARRAGASGYQGHEATSVEAYSAPLTRGMRKMGSDASPGEPFTAQAEHEASQLRFSSGSFTPEPGIDDRLQRAVDAAASAASGEQFTYAFALTDELVSTEMTDELAAIGVEVLGPHDGAIKIKLPLDRNVLSRLMQLPHVEWVGYSPPEQKIDATLKQATAAFAGEVEEFPLVITLFEHDVHGRFAARLQALGVVLGRYDPELQTYRAVASVAEITELAALDFVLFVEVERPIRANHNQSMATMGVDYIRPGGAGARFGGGSTVVGVLDTGFMLGSAAPVAHFDLLKFGCGLNLTSDAAGVWNDQDGHGTQVLATIVGTGTADPRLSGVAPRVGGTAATAIRAAKILDRNGDGTSAWIEGGIDFMGEASACGSRRPLVINMSLGGDGVGLTGTDSVSRRLDAAVWSNRQAYVVAAGNSGPSSHTVNLPAVAKNAITVGNVRDNGYLRVGDLDASSSLGPTGDGRMKPNVVAVGSVVRSARAGTTTGYVNLSGTSMAAPHVTGIAATLMEHYPEFRSRPDLLRAHLMATALLHDGLTTPGSNAAGGRNDYGLGRVSSYVAHWSRLNANGWSTHRAWSTITDTNWAFHDIVVPDGTDRLVVVMSWDEPPASAGAARAVTYDLDLWVDHQADCVPDAKGQCGEWTSQSSVDNTEYLIINNPPAGTYRLKIVNWLAPSFGLPASLAATVIRGDPTPAMTLSATPSQVDPPVGSLLRVTTRVSSPSYVTSGAHLALTTIPAGLRLLSVTTARKDGVSMNFGPASALTLGDIVERDPRTAIWRFRVDTARRQGPRVPCLVGERGHSDGKSKPPSSNQLARPRARRPRLRPPWRGGGGTAYSAFSMTRRLGSTTARPARRGTTSGAGFMVCVSWNCGRNMTGRGRKRLEELRSQRWFGGDSVRSFNQRTRLRELGWTAEEFRDRPAIGIINTWSEMNSCHSHFPDRVQHVKRGVLQAGGFPFEMPAMSLSEIMVKPTTMLYRNFLAMEVEELIRSHPLDGVVLMGGCDKTTPGLLMGAISADVPAIFVPAGAMLRGYWRGRTLGSGTDVWASYADYRAGKVDAATHEDMVAGVARSAGTCMTMGTAATMMSLAETLGFTLPGASSIPAVDANHQVMCAAAGRRTVEMAWEDLKPSDILTAASFDNAITVNMAIGGSTNAIIHLTALAGRAGIELPLARFDALSRTTPVVLNLKPSGQYLMEDFYYAGGLRALLARMAPRLELSCRTVTGTLGAQIEGAVVYNEDVILADDRALSREGGTAVLYGSLAPDGAVIKPPAAEPHLLTHEGPAVVFRDYDDMAARIDDPDLPVTPESVLVLQNAGPLGGPGMPEWGQLPLPKKLLEQGVRDMVRISDARMSGTSYGACVLHVSPEAHVGGPLGLVREGDLIRLDVPNRRLDLLVDEAELARRRAGWKPVRHIPSRGYVSMFARHVTQAHRGCDFDFLHAGEAIPEPEIH